MTNCKSCSFVAAYSAFYCSSNHAKTKNGIIMKKGVRGNGKGLRVLKMKCACGGHSSGSSGFSHSSGSGGFSHSSGSSRFSPSSQHHHSLSSLAKAMKALLVMARNKAVDKEDSDDNELAVCFTDFFSHLKRAIQILKAAIKEFQRPVEKRFGQHNNDHGDDYFWYEEAKERQRNLAGDFLKTCGILATDCLMLFNVCDQFLFGQSSSQLDNNAVLCGMWSSQREKMCDALIVLMKNKFSFRAAALAAAAAEAEAAALAEAEAEAAAVGKSDIEKEAKMIRSMSMMDLSDSGNNNNNKTKEDQKEILEEIFVENQDTLRALESGLARLEKVLACVDFALKAAAAKAEAAETTYMYETASYNDDDDGDKAEVEFQSMEDAQLAGKHAVELFTQTMCDILSSLCYDAWTLVGNPQNEYQLSSPASSDSSRNSEVRNLFFFKDEEKLKLDVVDVGFAHIMQHCGLLGSVTCNSAAAEAAGCC